MRYICSCVQCLHALFHLSLQQLAAVDTIMTVDFIYLGLQYSWIHLLAKIYVKPWNTHWWQCHHHCWTSTCAEQQKFELTDAHLPRWGWTRRHSAFCSTTPRTLLLHRSPRHEVSRHFLVLSTFLSPLGAFPLGTTSSFLLSALIFFSTFWLFLFRLL